MAKLKVFISTSNFAQNDPAPLKALADAGFDVTLNPYKRKLTKSEALQLYPQYDGVIAGLETLDEEVLMASTLKVISRCGAGVSNVDFNAAKKLNIAVCSTPNAPTVAVAELTVMAMLMLLRSVVVMNQDLHAGQWQKKLGFQLEGKTVVIVGFGRIGRKVAKMLEPFSVKIIPVDVNDRLSEALPKADIVTIHVNGEEELLGTQEFALMKQGVLILNPARGEVINEAAFIAALESGKVAGAWCDVFHQEPYQGPLLKFPQVILTPHIASNTEECRRLMEMQAATNLIAAFGAYGKK